MVYTVYRTTNIVNGKYYIGVHKTKDPLDVYVGSGKVLKRAIRKYGIENFQKEVIACFDSKVEAFSLEAEMVTREVIESGECYNLKLGGSGGFDFINETDLRDNRTPESIRAGGRVAIRILHNRRATDKDFRDRLYQCQVDGYTARHENGFSFLGKTHTETTKQKQSVSASSRVGDRNSSFGSMWITDGTSNRKIKKGATIPEGWHRGRI